MIVDQPHRLHEGVGGRRSDEAEAVRTQALRQRLRLRRRHRHVAARARGAASPARCERPHEGGERAVRALDLAHALCVVHGGLDLAAMADDRGVAEQTGDVGSAEARDRRGHETAKRAPEPVALAEDGQPRQARLESLERELLVERAIVERRPAPFVVVVVAIERIAVGPPAARPRWSRCRRHPRRSGRLRHVASLACTRTRDKYVEPGRALAAAAPPSWIRVRARSDLVSKNAPGGGRRAGDL